MEFVNHNRRNVKEFLSQSGYVRPIRDIGPTGCIVNPDRCPKSVAEFHGRQYFSPGQRILYAEKQRSLCQVGI